MMHDIVLKKRSFAASKTVCFSPTTGSKHFKNDNEHFRMPHHRCASLDGAGDIRSALSEQFSENIEISQFQCFTFSPSNFALLFF
jgi:hypothetical protein